MRYILAAANPLSLIVVINVIVLYAYSISSKYFLMYMVPLTVLAGAYTSYLNSFLKVIRRSNVNRSLYLTSIFWKCFGIVIVIICVAELFYFGIPLFGHVRYVDFGFGLLHHIAVTTWILVFIKYRMRWLNNLMLVFALIFPLLIFNRDLFLLTLCCIIFARYLVNKLSVRHLLIVASLFVLLFSQAGKLRSGNVHKIIELPLNFDLDTLGLAGFWIFTYVTSPMFNIHYNFESLERALYEPLLTVFPEFYKIMQIYPFFGMYLYFLIGLTLVVFPAILRFPGWLSFSFFFYYQFTMGCVFGNKLLNTHSLYVVLLFLVLGALRQVLNARSNRKLLIYVPAKREL